MTWHLQFNILITILMFFSSLLKKSLLYSGLIASTISSQQLFCANNNTRREVYIWGNGIYQARPDALLQFHNFSPKKIDNLPHNLIHLEFGEYYQAGIDADGTLFVWLAQTTDSNLDENSTKDHQRVGLKEIAKNVKEVRFTTGYIWTLTQKGEVIQYPIIKEIDQQQTVKGVRIGEKRVVDPLKGSVQISTGTDHIISLHKNGTVYAMGDDTYGQCGQADTTRHPNPPYTQKRVSFPVEVQYLKNVRKIASGENFNLALDGSGTLYGWGSNSTMQLSHEEEFSRMENPLLLSFTPIKISKNLDNNQILDIAAGGQHSIILTKNKQTQAMEVFSVGNNLRGQLGLGEIKHLRDVSKIQALSNYVLKKENKQVKVQVQQLRCGYKHCIALLNIGYIMSWGDNEYGQMGNKKRSSSYTPMILKEFTGKKIVGVYASANCSGVILEEEDVPKQGNATKSGQEDIAKSDKNKLKNK